MNAPKLRDLVGRAFARGADWRYFALFGAGILVPTSLAYVPVAQFLQGLLDASPRGKELVSALDSPALVEVVRQLGEPAGAAIGPGMIGTALITAVVAPFLAGAALVVARKSGASSFRSLLGGAAERYPRMIRTAIASCIPLGVAAGGAGLAFHFATKTAASSVTESGASNAKLLATIASVLLFWLANVTVEAGRAHFAAEPERRSALGAWWSGVRLLVRRPVQVLALSVASTVVGVGGALVLTGIRLRISQTGAGSIGVAFVIAQGAVAAVAWGRASRIAGLVTVIRAEEGG